MSGKKTVAEPPGTLPCAQEPLRSQSKARNRNDSPAGMWRVICLQHIARAWVVSPRRSDSPQAFSGCTAYYEYLFVIYVNSIYLVFFNPKETSWGLKGPVAYISYHCVSLKNRFLLKRYVFLKNIVLHNIMCETNWIVITTKFDR